MVEVATSVSPELSSWRTRPETMRSDPLGIDGPLPQAPRRPSVRACRDRRALAARALDDGQLAQMHTLEVVKRPPQSGRYAADGWPRFLGGAASFTCVLRPHNRGNAWSASIRAAASALKRRAPRHEY